MKTLFTIITMATMITASAQTIGKYANVNGLKMYYEIHGEGFPLVLIHGGGSSIDVTFGRVLAALAKSHRVIAVDMQAHGRTADIDRPFSFQQDADDIAELLKQLKISKADIFGFSNGASTTLEIAIRHPQIVNKMIVASTMYKKAGTDPGFWKMMAHPDFNNMPQELKDAYLHINPDKDALYTMFKRDATRMQNFTDISESDVENIKAPALIIVGNKDVPLPEHGLEMHRKMKNSQLAILPGGHGDYLGALTATPGGNEKYPVLSIIESFLAE